MDALDKAGFQLVLYITPALNETPPLPDHHSLATARGGIVLSELEDDAADALLRALTVVDNPYRRLKRSNPKP